MICVSGVCFLAGIIVMGSPQMTWRVRLFFDNYAPAYMPDYWEMTNRRIGLGLVAAGLLLIFGVGLVA